MQTLLAGITVGGHKLQDELITLNQIKAWKFLFESLEKKTFSLSLAYVLELHTLVAKNEALTWGEFRTGRVSISGTEYCLPAAKDLDRLWHELAGETQSKLLRNQSLQKGALPTLNKNSVYIAAINLFAKMARTQFFFGGN